MDQYIGKLLDNRYEILERIGSGGMAVVYKARCHRLNRLVAIKILKSDLAQDAEFRRRFHDESQAVAMLSHPNIVAVYDVSHSDDLDYIVMELIDGITLKQYMQKKGEPLNWREALHFITQIMKGLSHAHSRGIIHRDIKPHNIMVLRDGSVKVADFGIARLTSAAQNTLTQEALGSVHYISPEQARGSYIDARSDIYSAGVVLYEMLTGRLPYEGDSPISVAIQHINSIPLSPREINPDIPEALEEITMKAMASNVDQRYISADAMLADLEEFRKNPSINFDYADVDLLNSSDEPTQVMKTGGMHSNTLHGAGGAAARQTAGNGQRRGTPEPQRHRKSREEDYEDDYDDVDRRDRSEKGSPVPIILAIGAIIIFLAGIGYFLWVSFLGPLLNPDIPLYTTPRVVGMTLEEAQNSSTVLDNGFTVEVEKTVESEEYPEGEIMEQSPEANTQVQSGERTIKVTVSGGSSSDIKMDDYENRRLDEVRTLLESKGIIVNVEEQSSEEVTKDYIISQSPEEGTALKAGDEVTLVVSTGPNLEPVTMIDLRGLTLEKAREWLDKMDLILGTPVEVYDDVQPAGVVVSQDKEPSTEVLPKTIVNLTVSKGPDPNAGATESPEPSESGGEPATPPPTESTEPSPSPSPSQPTVQKTIRIELPSDRDLVHVVVTVNGQTQYDDTVDTVFRVITPPLTAPEGTMQAEVCVYLDDQLQSTTYIDFVK
ncbi:Stk1 family PASTA domain-containing Ser/Thr kinase [Pseudoflavonifractor capillosus]|uniref:non-specific serine/threonine protein kinase n=1 Tax=Pseudoflavonifractor capillosus TaxID=106588 RepID=A0A921MKU2_9FIRM|nr:Stk1 family PASTA domain-containing Ser/Thr kinase [Pseudoflavonifractor capillosus]HJG86388.1 Stk1 family PASTA domain-containing Ser/Thr kinase [Pseudoflavonifractor capillosus]